MAHTPVYDRQARHLDKTFIVHHQRLVILDWQDDGLLDFVVQLETALNSEDTRRTCELHLPDNMEYSTYLRIAELVKGPI